MSSASCRVTSSTGRTEEAIGRDRAGHVGESTGKFVTWMVAMHGVLVSAIGIAAGLVLALG